MDNFSPGILDDNTLPYLGKHTSSQVDTVQHRQLSDHTGIAVPPDTSASVDDLPGAESSLAANLDSGTPVSDQFNAGIQPGDIEDL